MSKLLHSIQTRLQIILEEIFQWILQFYYLFVTQNNCKALKDIDKLILNQLCIVKLLEVYVNEQCVLFLCVTCTKSFFLHSLFSLFSLTFYCIDSQLLLKPKFANGKLPL